MDLVFMGTPDFAAASLESLISAGHNIKGVFSQPDKPVGRKQTVMPTAVKAAARQYGIPVFQPDTLRDGEAERMLRELSPEAVVVVAYGKLIPHDMLILPKYGFINVHASLLPKYRGAAPIQWAIINGDKVTGVTTMLLNDGMDTGDILLERELEILPDETAGELFERLSALGGELIVETLANIDNITPRPQDEKNSSKAEIIKKEMALIDFSLTAAQVRDRVRGFCPWPVAFTFYKGKRLKVYRASLCGETKAKPGTVVKADGEIVVACGGGTSVRLDEIQLEGSKRMNAAEFLKGNNVDIGYQF